MIFKSSEFFISVVRVASNLRLEENNQTQKLRANIEMSEYPNDDLPNQEKNQYLTFYWWESGALRTKGR